MLAFSRSRSGAWVAIVAAGVFVLQLLLTGMLATQMAVAAPVDSFAICHANPEGTGDLPQPGGTTHAVHHPCIICSFVSTGALPPPLVTIAFVRVIRTAVIWQGPRAPIFVSKQRSPQVPQGPPQIA